MRVKLKHFKENAASDLVLEPWKDGYDTLAGRWHEVFGSQRPLVIELGCGRGAYAIGLAKAHPEWNVLGVDTKGDRLWYGMKEAEELNLQNVRFLRGRIERIETFFTPGEVHEIWLTFPDPHPKRRSSNRRLTSERFLTRYAHMLRPGGVLHLKTDSLALHEFTKAVISQQKDYLLKEVQADIRTLPSNHLLQTLQTQYERKYRAEGRPITYLRLQKRSSLASRFLDILPFLRALTKKH